MNMLLRGLLSGAAELFEYYNHQTTSSITHFRCWMFPELRPNSAQKLRPKTPPELRPKPCPELPRTAPNSARTPPVTRSTKLAPVPSYASTANLSTNLLLQPISYFQPTFLPWQNTTRSCLIRETFWPQPWPSAHWGQQSAYYSTSNAPGVASHTWGNTATDRCIHGRAGGAAISTMRANRRIYSRNQ